MTGDLLDGISKSYQFNHICVKRDEKEISDATKGSQLQDFYKDQTVFITGATGFLGTLLVEKLLRCCPQIRKLILLIRGRGSKSVEERVKDFFSEDVFEKMKLVNPNYHQKVDIVCGQLDAENLGLDSNDQRLLTSQTTVIFHVAATVRFDEHIRKAYNINVKGTETLLDFARIMPHLKSFVHVSTAYCNCDHPSIDEVFYPPTYTAKELSILVNSSSDEEMAVLNPHLLGKKPNTYTLTKATAEDLVREVVHELPICVFRPSIVLPTMHEPLPSWFKGFNPCLAIGVTCGTGLARVTQLDRSVVIDIVPADRTINALIALAWYQTISNSNQTEELNYQSSSNSTGIEEMFCLKCECGNQKLCPKNEEGEKILSSLEENNNQELYSHNDGTNQILCSLKQSKILDQYNENSNQAELKDSLKEAKIKEFCPNKEPIDMLYSHEKEHAACANKEDTKRSNNVSSSQNKDIDFHFQFHKKDSMMYESEENKSSKKNINNIEVLKEKRFSYSAQNDRKVFNYVSYNDNRLTLFNFVKMCSDTWGMCRESNNVCIWTNHTYWVANTKVYIALFYILHSIPSIVFSVAEKMQGRKPMILKTYRKIFFLTKYMGYFCLNDWIFDSRNTKALTDALSPQDRTLFDASVGNFRWESFIDTFPRSVGLYMLKERMTKKDYDERMVYIVWTDFCIWVIAKMIGVYLVLHFLAGLINTLGAT